MITFLCWYFGISITYTVLLYLILISYKVFYLLLERSKDTHFNDYLNLRSNLLYLPITFFILSVLVSPLNLVSKMLSVTLQVIEKIFVKAVGGQEDKYRLKAKHHLESKYNIETEDDDKK